jgi:hypothetical protein
MMKAIVWTKYGSPDGLQLRELAKPTPRDNEVLIKVYAATASQAAPSSAVLPPVYILRLYLGFRKNQNNDTVTEFPERLNTVKM